MMTYYKKCRIYGVVSVAFSVLFAFSEFAVAEPLSVFNGKTVVGVQQTKRTISGIVKDATGAIIGATVMEKGSNNGAVTNINGEFTLNVSPGATLVISYIGYKDHVITVDNQDFITISMVEDTQKLNEVVVVGYGTQKKVNLSGAGTRRKLSIGFSNTPAAARSRSRALPRRALTASSCAMRATLSPATF